MPYIYVTRKIPEIGIKILQDQNWDIYVHPDQLPPSREELLKRVKGASAILSLLTDKIDKEVFDAAGPSLKIVANYAVGYDNIDVEEATKRGIIVTNTPGVLTDTTADFGWALLMAIARRVVEADEYARSGKWKTWEPTLLLGSDVHKKTLGIIGFGKIGKTVAKRAQGFDMNILYYDPIKADSETEKALNAQYVDLETLLKNSDFVIICAKLTPENRHMINKDRLKLMKPTAYLINIGRGAIVDEEALVWALKNQVIKGAGLDVFENEPKIHPELIKLKNVVLAPHIGSASKETREKMATMAATSIVKVLNGETPENIVNPEVLEKFNQD